MEPLIPLFLSELAERGALTPEQASRIEGLARSGADAEALVRAAGVSDDDWLDAASDAFGLARAPRTGLDPGQAADNHAALVEAGFPMERDFWIRQGCVPFVVATKTYVAFARGLAAIHAESLGLPVHRAVLAVPGRIAAFRDALIPPTTSHTTSPPPSTPPPMAGDVVLPTALPESPSRTVHDPLQSGGWWVHGQEHQGALDHSIAAMAAPLEATPNGHGADEADFGTLDFGPVDGADVPKPASSAVAPPPLTAPATSSTTERMPSVPLDSGVRSPVDITTMPSTSPTGAPSLGAPRLVAPPLVAPPFVAPPAMPAGAGRTQMLTPVAPKAADADRTQAVQTGRVEIVPALPPPQSHEAERTTAVQTGRITLATPAPTPAMRPNGDSLSQGTGHFAPLPPPPLSHEAERTTAVQTGRITLATPPSTPTTNRTGRFAPAVPAPESHEAERTTAVQTGRITLATTSASSTPAEPEPNRSFESAPFEAVTATSHETLGARTPDTSSTAPPPAPSSASLPAISAPPSPQALLSARIVVGTPMVTGGFSPSSFDPFSSPGFAPAPHTPATPQAVQTPVARSRGDAAVMASMAQEESPPDGPRVGKWRVERALGAGAAADVYLAVSDGGQQAALKILRLDGGTADDQRARFEREANLIARLAHVNVVRLYDRGITEGRPWMACEFVDGGSVAELMQKTGPMPTVLAARIVCDVLRGLQPAHELGVVHRDLKPGNLLLTRAGVCKVADFGVAKVDDNLALTQEGVAYGTPAYMSPEQASGQKVDHRSDLFSVGTIFWHLLTGENPFLGSTVPATLMEVSRAEPGDLLVRAPSVPLLVERVVAKLLTRDPDDRYASAGHVLADLQPLLDWIEVHEPGIVVRAIASPSQTIQRLKRSQAELEERRARAALARRPSMRQEAALSRLRSLSLHDDDDVREALTELCTINRYYLDHPRLDQLPDVVQGIQRSEASLPLLRRAGLAHFDAGNLVEAFWYLRRFVHRGGVADDVVGSRLRMLQGQAPMAPFELPRGKQGEDDIAADRALAEPTQRLSREEADAELARIRDRTEEPRDAPQRRAALMPVAIVVTAALSVGVGVFLGGRRQPAPVSPTPVVAANDGLALAEARRLYNDALASDRSGDANTAILLCEQAWKKAPGSLDAARASVLAGQLYLKAGDPKKARRSLERALSAEHADSDTRTDARAALASVPE